MNLTINKKPSLGIGVYTIPDVANILNLDKILVRRWLKEYWGNQFGNKHASFSAWGKGREKSVHFFTLIEFYVFFQLRMHGVSAQNIAKSHEIIGHELQTSFPFANSRILTDGKKIFYSTDGELIINADKSKQINIKGIIENFCHKIDFDSEKKCTSLLAFGERKKYSRRSPSSTWPTHYYKHKYSRRNRILDVHRGGKKSVSSLLCTI